MVKAVSYKPKCLPEWEAEPSQERSSSATRAAEMTAASQRSQQRGITNYVDWVGDPAKDNNIILTDLWYMLPFTNISNWTSGAKNDHYQYSQATGSAANT